MRKLGVVIFGASVYDHHTDLGNPRFANSAKEFQKTCCDPTIIGPSDCKVLNLFNKTLSPATTTSKIIEFVEDAFDDIVIYYCGHGVLPLGKKAYSIYLRSTKKLAQNTSALGFADFIRDLDRFLIGKRVFIVIDACYSGEAIRELMDPNAAAALIDERLLESLPRAGMAVFTASEPDTVARALTEDRLTLFTGTLIETLKKGIASHSGSKMLSWADVGEQVVEAIRARLRDEAPIPRWLAVRAAHGDITKMPFFANQAYVPGEDVPDKKFEYPYWMYISERVNLELFDDFLTKFPNGIYAALAASRMKELIAAKSVPELRQYLRDFPTSRGHSFAQSQLVSLEWQRVKEGSDIAALERFIEEFPGTLLVEDAKRRIDAVRKEIADEQAWWERIKTTADASELDRFLAAHPNGPFSEAARIRRAELPAQPEPAAPPPPPAEDVAVPRPTGTISISMPEIGETPIQDGKAARGIRAFVGSVAGILSIAAIALVLAGLVYLGIHRGGGDQYRAELAAAGDDVAALRAFLARCRAAPNCPAAAEAEARLKRAEGALEQQTQIAKFRSDLQAAGDDVAALSALVARCQASANCPVLAEARAQLQRAQAEREQTKFRNDLRNAGDDVAALSALVARCQASPICPVLAEARAQLQRAQAGREQAKFWSDLRDAGNDVAALSALVARCQASPNCPVLAEARAQLQRAQAGREQAKFWSDLRDAGNDIGRLTDLVVRCRASPNCAVLADATEQLKRAEAARDQLILENSFGRYLSWDLDLGSPSQLLQTIKPSNGVDACEASCQANRACKGYSFDKWNRICYLKSEFVTFSADPRTDSGVRKSVRAPYASAAPKRFCTYGNSTIEGDAIRTIANSADWEACKDSCANDSKCVAYTLLSANNSCRLLASTSDRFTGRAGYYSGIKSQNADCQK